jgi:hypothetical protein
MPKFIYTTCCVNADGEDIAAMVDCAINVTYATIRKHCAGLAEWERNMGYERLGLKLKDDWAVRFHRSRYRGRRCYYIRHSAIEYIWTEQTR